jgi:hypothetical protein
MKLNFKYGFEYKGFLYGWNKKNLYRLPSKSGNKNYGLKLLNPIMVGNSFGYRIKKQKLSISQLKQLTIRINQKIEMVEDNIDIP